MYGVLLSRRACTDFTRWGDIHCSQLSKHRPHQELDFDCVLDRQEQAWSNQRCPMSPLGNIWIGNIWIGAGLSSHLSVLPATLHPAGTQRQQLLRAGYMLPPLHVFAMHSKKQMLVKVLAAASASGCTDRACKPS